MDLKALFLAATLTFSMNCRAGSEMRMDLCLLIGQSNMAGRGTVEPEDLKVHPPVLTLNKDNEWVPAVDPIHFDKKQAGVGPGRSFGIAMAERDPTVRIGLIPCAVGGTSIRKWRPGAEDLKTHTHPYDTCSIETLLNTGRMARTCQ
jgi:hypothetical protein